MALVEIAVKTTGPKNNGAGRIEEAPRTVGVRSPKVGSGSGTMLLCRICVEQEGVGKWRLRAE